ncbi:L,D-transpeptidase [Martelella mediterranea]|nr:L,D-transpeptidase [Martelella mediterranea]
MDPYSQYDQAQSEEVRALRQGCSWRPDQSFGLAGSLFLYRDGRDTLYRIHGTTEPSSIGRSVSNGCIRMINDHVEDLFERVPVGARVVVL